MSEFDSRDLPPGWELATVGEVAVYVQRGKSPKYIGTSDLPVINQKCVRWDEIQAEHLKFVHPDQWDKWADERILQAGDILWNSTGTGTIGRAAIFRGLDGFSRVVADSHVTVIRLGEYLPEVLHSWIRSPAIQNRIEGMQSGSTNQVELSKGEVLATPLPVPPFNEQRRIADKLDAVLARVDACRDRLERVPAILKRFRQSVLAGATSGKLTEDWRQSNPSAPAWRSGKLESLLEGKPRNGFSPRSVDHETPVKTLTLTATTSGTFLPQHFKYVDVTVPESSHLWLQPGDILIQRANTLEYVGVSAIYDGPPSGFIYPDLMMKCRANDEVLTEFLHLVLLSEPVRGYLRKNATGTAGNMPKINQKTVLSAPVVWPSVEEQREIVRRAAALFEYADRVDARFGVALSLTSRLTPALLTKAFRGELVPQDPDDEPARVLLERIRAERAALVTKTRRSRGGRRTRTGEKPEVSMLDRSEIDEKHLSSILKARGPLTAEALWSASQLGIDDFYDQLKDEEARGFLVEKRTAEASAARMLEAAA